MKKKGQEVIVTIKAGQPAAQGQPKRVYSEEEQSRFRAALDSSIDAIFLIDRQLMRFIDANETASAILGYSQEELLRLGPQDLKPDHGELALMHRRFDKIINSDTKTGMIRTVHQRKDGIRLPVEVYLRALPLQGRQILVAVVRDLTLQLQAEAQLRDSEERFRVAFSQAAVGLAHIAADGRWLMVNQKLCQILGYSQPELLNMTERDLTHPDDLAAEERLGRRQKNRSLSEKTREKRYRHKDGHFIWVNFTSSPVRDASGQPKYYSVVVEDISRRKRVEDQLQHLANYDVLTGLPNRSLLQDRLSQAIAYAKRLDKPVAVMVIDLDRFKNLNDSLGHHAGDQILIEIARRLSSNLLEGDTVGRLGGDEFVFVLADSAEEDVTMQAQQALELVSQPIVIEGHDFYPSGSIGISLYPKDGQDGQSLLKNADTAMYRAKEAGRNNFQFYASAMNARALDRLKLESGLRRALEREEFVLHYQPQIDIGSGRIIGMEALLRWLPPGQSMLPPDEFIPIAEETGLIVPIGEWALRAACAQNLAWQAAGLPLLRMGVNLSARQFQQQDVVKMVSRVLQQLNYPAHGLTLEITESVVMEKPEQAAATLQHLSDMGIHLSIDDFGTGYSSLNYLKRFPIHSLKIDKSFVHDITTDSDDAAIAKAVIVLAHSLKLDVIAEGVETIEQLDFLRQQECDQMQGFYYSRPLPADRLQALLQQEFNRT